MVALGNTPSLNQQPAAKLAASRRAGHKPRKALERILLTSSQAAPQQAPTSSKDLSQEDTQRALQYQLDRSTRQAPAAVQPEHEIEDYEKDLVLRQRSAREWITPWLVVVLKLCHKVFCTAAQRLAPACRRSRLGTYPLIPLLLCGKTPLVYQLSSRTWH